MTRADLSFVLVHNIELLTHFAKRAENERCFSTSRQNRDRKKTMKKTEMAKKYTTKFSSTGTYQVLNLVATTTSR
jgi:hypothetical protein